MPRISVIVPVYKVEEYLERCLDSILEQTFSDYELILVDDGSPDRCGEICDQYAEAHTDITVIHKQNGGLSSARNAGLKYANCEWITFVDSDDVIHPDFLRLLYLTAINTDANMAVCRCLQEKDIPADFFDSPNEAYVQMEITEDSLLELYTKKERAYWTVVPTLVKKSIVEKYPFTEGRIFEDNAVSVSWLSEAGKVVYLNAQLYFYYINPDGIVNEAFSKKRLDFLWALNQQLLFYQRIGYQKMLSEITKEYVNTAIWFANRVKNELDDPDSARNIIRDAQSVRKKYANHSFDTDLDKKLFKAAHPLLHKMKKKIVFIFNNYLKKT